MLAPIRRARRRRSVWRYEFFLFLLGSQSRNKNTSVDIWMFPKIAGFPPKSSNFNRVFQYKPSILGYPYFWKHPLSIMCSLMSIVYDSDWHRKRWTTKLLFLSFEYGRQKSSELPDRLLARYNFMVAIVRRFGFHRWKWVTIGVLFWELNYEPLGFP